MRAPHWGDLAFCVADLADGDPSSRDVVCQRALAPGRFCRQVLVCRYTYADRWQQGVLRTVLVFAHDKWELHNGLWRERPEVRERRRRGHPPRTRTLPERYWEPEVKDFVLVGGYTAVPELPALVLCPNPHCSHRRVLDGHLLDAVGATSVGWVCDRPGRGARSTAH
jgi:hypothetical protein